MALADYVAAVLADSPRAYWKLDEASGLPQDSSGNGFHMTNSNSTSGAPTYHATGPMLGGDFAIAFLRSNLDGFSRSTSITSAVDNFTYELWMNWNGGTTDEGYIMCNIGSGVGHHFEMRQPSKKLEMTYDAVADMGLSATTFVASTWYHVVMLRRSGTTFYYVNGALDSTKGTNTPNIPTQGPTIALPNTTPATSNTFDGSLAHCAYYQTALSAARILVHYNAALAYPAPIAWTTA